jgi:hypothetical protein
MNEEVEVSVTVEMDVLLIGKIVIVEMGQKTVACLMQILQDVLIVIMEPDV